MLTTAQGNGVESLKISKNPHTQTEQLNTLVGQREIHIPNLSDENIKVAQAEVKELISSMFNPIQIFQTLEEAQFLLVASICADGACNNRDLESYRVLAEIKASLGTHPILLTLTEQVTAINP